MSFSFPSKKRATSGSPKQRSKPNPLSKVHLTPSPGHPVLYDSKPEFKVFQSRSTGPLGVGDLSSVNLPTDDSFMYRNYISTINQQKKNSPLRNLQNSDEKQRLASEPDQIFNITNSAEKTMHNEHIHEELEGMEYGMFNISENPEVNEILKTLEKRFARLEKRLETNEGLVHLHDEMQRLHHMEKRSAMNQESNTLQELQTRLTGLEHKLGILEADLKSHKAGIDYKLDDFTKKIEQYLDKFVSTTSALAQKFDSLVSVKDSENNSAKEKLEEVEGKLEKVNEEIREKLKVLYDTVENVGKLTQQTSSVLENEKYNVRRLEDDFLKLLSSSKDASQWSGDVKWLSDEIFALKSRQMNVLNYLNSGNWNGNKEEFGTPQKEDQYN